MPITIINCKYVEFYDELDSKNSYSKDETAAYSFFSLHKKLLDSIKSNAITTYKLDSAVFSCWD